MLYLSLWDKIVGNGCIFIVLSTVFLRLYKWYTNHKRTLLSNFLCMLDLLISMQKTIYLQKYIINILIVILRHLCHINLKIANILKVLKVNLFRNVLLKFPALWLNYLLLCFSALCFGLTREIIMPKSKCWLSISICLEVFYRLHLLIVTTADLTIWSELLSDKTSCVVPGRWRRDLGWEALDMSTCISTL